MYSFCVMGLLQKIKINHLINIFEISCLYSTPNVSMVDLVIEVAKDTTVEEVNAALAKAAAGELKGVLAYSEEPLVSIDYNGNPNSSIVDALSTMVMGGTLVKVISWYDNEWGYSNRVVDLVKYITQSL